MIRLIFFMFLLAGCTQKTIQTKVVEIIRPQPVTELHDVYVDVEPKSKKCLPDPSLPPKETDSAMGQYIAGLSAAADDCRAKLENQ